MTKRIRLVIKEHGNDIMEKEPYKLTKRLFRALHSWIISSSSRSSSKEKFSLSKIDSTWKWNIWKRTKDIIRCCKYTFVRTSVLLLRLWGLLQFKCLYLKKHHTKERFCKPTTQHFPQEQWKSIWYQCFKGPKTLKLNSNTQYLNLHHKTCLNTRL